MCKCPLPLVGQNLAENEKKQVKVFNLISNTPRPQKKSYSETSRLPCVPKVKTNEVLSSTSEDGREFGGRPHFLSLGLQFTKCHAISWGWFRKGQRLQREKVLLLDENNFSIPVSGLSTASDAEDRLSLTFSFTYSLANAEINSLATIFLPIWTTKQIR